MKPITKFALACLAILALITVARIAKGQGIASPPSPGSAIADVYVCSTNSVSASLTNNQFTAIPLYNFRVITIQPSYNLAASAVNSSNTTFAFAAGLTSGIVVSNYLRVPVMASGTTNFSTAITNVDTAGLIYLFWTGTENLNTQALNSVQVLVHGKLTQ